VGAEGGMETMSANRGVYKYIAAELAAAKADGRQSALAFTALQVGGWKQFNAWVKQVRIQNGIDKEGEGEGDDA
jgi:hypothetical protein